jgi:hypothetical protein
MSLKNRDGTRSSSQLKDLYVQRLNPYDAVAACHVLLKPQARTSDCASGFRTDVKSDQYDNKRHTWVDVSILFDQ